MKLFLRLLTTAVFGASFLSPATAFKPEFPYGKEKIRGVNLGGWLIVQVWCPELPVFSFIDASVLAMDHPVDI